MKHSPFAGAAASFAHLLGRRPAAAKRAEDEDRKDEHCEDESDEDEEKAEDESDESKRCEDDEEDKEKAEDTDGDGDEGEDTDKDGAKKAKGFKAGAVAERKRCAAIFGAAAAADRPDLAAHLAFNTSLSAKDAVGLLTAAAEPAKGSAKRGLSDRMASVQTPNVGADGGAPAPAADTPAGIVARMKAVYDRAIGQ